MTNIEINELLTSIFQLCIIPLLAVLTRFVIKWIDAQANKLKQNTKNEIEQKYIDMLNNTITAAVIAVNQTYVDELKDKNAFDKTAQQEAFKRVYETVILTLTEEANIYLQEIIGDLNSYITTKIEEAVKINKKNKGESI